MSKLRTTIIAASVAVACGIPAAALANLSGNYLVTLTGAHPSSYNGTQFCAQLNDNGSVLGWTNSGPLAISSQNGQFFVHHGNIAGWIVTNSGSQFYAGHIAGHGNGVVLTSFAYLDSSGNAIATGGLSNQHKGSC